MNKNNFWNEAAKYGAIIGAILAASFVLENRLILSGNLSLYGLLVVEWIVVVVLHYYLLHRYTRQRSMLYSADEGFTFGQGYSYVLVISAFGGIIVGVVQYLFLHLIVGYANYVDKQIAAFTDIMSMSGGASMSMQPMVTQMIDQLQNAPAPSVIATVWGGLLSGLLFGAIFGLIIAGTISRAPKPFDSEHNA